MFGPVSTQGLIVWAEQGRILPGHEVSPDRKKWVQAVSVEALDMRWFVDEGTGELRGPLNRLAAEALLKSGKVPETAQLVSADDIDLPETAAPAAPDAPKPPGEPVPEDVLRVRIRELETMVSSQRERLAKLSNADALETVQHERDVLSSLVKETEAQRDSLLRNAEKDARSYERKLDGLRQQIKKLEQQLEDAHSRLLQGEEAAAAAAAAAEAAPDGGLEALQAGWAETERRLTLALARAEAGQQAASAEGETLRGRLAEAERSLAEARADGARRLAERADEVAALEARVAELERARAAQERRAAEAGEQLAARVAERDDLRARLDAAARARDQAADRQREAEDALAELLTDANARDAEYLEKIAALEKACAQPPDETARFLASQAAMYDLVKGEIDELAATMEVERTHVEQLKEWSLRRLHALGERRQTLLKQLGGSPGEMTRRALREQPADPNAARMRAELDALRIAHEREMRQSEERERDLQRKLRVLETETGKLRGSLVENEKSVRRAQELGEALRKREQELADERRNREAEREQYQGSQQALLMRIETLEKSARPSTPDEVQSADARNVKLATWMRLKR